MWEIVCGNRLVSSVSVLWYFVMYITKNVDVVVVVVVLLLSTRSRCTAYILPPFLFKNKCASHSIIEDMSVITQSMISSGTNLVQDLKPM